MAQPAELPIETDVRTVKGLLDAKTPFVFVDCREQDEHNLVHIAGARLIPMSQMTARVDELAGEKNSHIVVHCHHGGRSLRVANWLRQQGFSQAQSMAGGIHAWAEQIDPSLPKY
jgi:rhodanese-related sulfurtransferase